MRKWKNGFTLVEILVAISISVVVGGLLMVVITNSAGVFYKESSKLEVGLNINDALYKVSRSIKQASNVAVAFTFGSTTYTSGLTQLVLKVASIDSSNNLISSTYDYYVFFLDLKKLRFKIYPDAASSRKAVDQIFSTNVNDVKFQYFNLANPPVEVSANSASKVRFTLTLKQKNGSYSETNTATSEASLRND